MSMESVVRDALREVAGQSHKGGRQRCDGLPLCVGCNEFYEQAVTEIMDFYDSRLDAIDDRPAA